MPSEALVSQYPDEQLEVFWERIKASINPFLYVACIDGLTYRMFDDGAKQYIARKFMEHVTENVMFCRDGNEGDRYYLGPPRFFMAGTGMIVHPVGTTEAIWVKRPADGLIHLMVVPPALPNKCCKIPRPPNAYILYRKDRHRLVKAGRPDIHNNEISQILGRAWNKESADVRLKYKIRADEIKQALLEKHPDYKYRPRRSVDKKRRAAAQTAQSTSIDAFVHATSDITDDDDVFAANTAEAS